MEEGHQQKVAQLFRSAMGRTGLLHKITEPTAWRGEAPILKKEEEDARLLDRCEVTRKERAKHKQCDQDLQNLEDKPWKNEELKKSEEALPRLNECGLEKVSKLYNGKTGVGCDGFHPKVPLDVTKETRGEIVEFLEEVEESAKWPQHACTTIFSLIPKNVTSERPIALLPTLIRWLEALRAPEVAKWQQKYRVDWDARNGRNGGAQQTVWKMLMEMERFNGQAKEEDQGALAVERVSLPVVWPWATHFSFPRKILRVLCDIRGEAILPGSKWGCLLLRIVLQDALSDVTQNLSSVEVEGLYG